MRVEGIRRGGGGSTLARPGLAGAHGAGALDHTQPAEPNRPSEEAPVSASPTIPLKSNCGLPTISGGCCNPLPPLRARRRGKREAAQSAASNRAAQAAQSGGWRGLRLPCRAGGRAVLGLASPPRECSSGVHTTGLWGTRLLAAAPSAAHCNLHRAARPCSGAACCSALWEPPLPRRWAPSLLRRGQHPQHPRWPQ